MEITLFPKPQGAKPQASIAKPFKSDIMKTIKKTEDKGNVDVYTVGKIDRNIYKCIAGEIVTDEVNITDERIKHIDEEDIFQDWNDVWILLPFLKDTGRKATFPLSERDNGFRI